MVNDLVRIVDLGQRRALVPRLPAGLAPRFSSLAFSAVGARFRRSVARRRFAAVFAVQRKAMLKSINPLLKGGNHICLGCNDLGLPPILLDKPCFGFPQLHVLHIKSGH